MALQVEQPRAGGAGHQQLGLAGGERHLLPVLAHGVGGPRQHGAPSLSPPGPSIGGTLPASAA